MSRLQSHLPPDLVVFDLDGTLHDTFRWWSPVIRAGLRRFAEQHQLAIEMPSDAVAEAVVGMRDSGVWAPFLPEGHKHRWQELRAMVVPMEVAEISRGEDYLFPGVRTLLPHLQKIGVKVALASNCRSNYMGGMLNGQGLAAISDWQLCLDSPGVESKQDMLRIAAHHAQARRMVMVGDREPDHEAAEALGWPFIWRRNNRCDLGHADATWDGDPDQLLRLLGLQKIS
ncbi:MAG: HAD family hydrolase [Planctomycetes bacterium]|nr:HAD family hydrolase [Planctomycetota bacterium]